MVGTTYELPTRVAMGSYEDIWSKTKKKKIQLRLINRIGFMASTLDSLSRNLFGVNGMIYEGCGNEVELTLIDENYLAHRMCGKCRGVNYYKLEINPTFNSLSQSYEQTVPTVAQKMNTWTAKKRSKRKPPPLLHLPRLMNSKADSTCRELVSVTTTMLKEFRMKNLGNYHYLYLNPV